MATKTYDDQYQPAIQDTIDLLEKVDLNNPTDNIIDPKASTLELLKVQQEIQAQTLGKTLEFVRTLVPLVDHADPYQLMGAQPGDKIPVQQQQTYLQDLAQKNYLITRMVQQRENERNTKTKGTYFDPTREPICEIPPEIDTGTNSTITDSSLKLLPTFKGDTNHEAENLKTFLRAIYDVAITNTLNEKCTKNVLKRKLQGTARKLIDSYEQEFKDVVDRPTLKEIVLKLENRFLVEYQPEVAQAKLSMYVKQPNQTYQVVEGEISELATLASRGENITNKQEWINMKKIAVFKQAVNDEDRAHLQKENQARSIIGLPEMDMSLIVYFLNKIYSEKNAFSTASNLKNNPKSQADNDSLNVIKEGQPKSKAQQKKDKKVQAEMKQLEEEKKVKDQLYALYMNNPNNSNRGNFRGNNRGNFRGNNRGGKGKWQGGRGNFNQGKPNQFNNGKPGSSTVTKPRKYVTPEMVNVSPHCCLKCDSPSHRFQETNKCAYGKSNLMTGPCKNCKKGGHHYNVCIKAQELPTVGAQKPQSGYDPKFSPYPDLTKTVLETQGATPNYTKNEWIPSLFPQ